jgi:predicted  nucleic acid-binding Zn-ribbon protein
MLDAQPANEMEPEESSGEGWHGPMLSELAELGMEMARLVMAGARARALAGEATAADEAASTLALQRTAKMVRLTAALDQRLKAAAAAEAGEPLPGFEIPADEEEARRRQAVSDTAWVMKNLWLLVGKPMVRNTVALAIETGAESGDRERLLVDLCEKLDEREEELIGRGPGQYEAIIEGLMEELGLPVYPPGPRSTYDLCLGGPGRADGA